MFGSTILDGRHDPWLYFSSSRERAGHLAIVRCRDCGLLLTNPRDDDATLARVYAALEDRVYLGEEESHRRTAAKLLALITKYCPKPGNLLDIGCATGSFVCAAHQAGWRATGVDASKWAIARARERCPDATFVNDLLENEAFEDSSFAAVTLWDVLEHVRSPAETLELVRKWLAPGGLLFLNVPSSDSLTARLMGRHWVLLLREHLWYFSRTSIHRLLGQAGFELIRTRPTLVRHSVANIAGRVAQYPGWLGRAAKPFARSRVLKRFVIWFPIGEMNIVARKKP